MLFIAFRKDFNKRERLSFVFVQRNHVFEFGYNLFIPNHEFYNSGLVDSVNKNKFPEIFAFVLVTQTISSLKTNFLKLFTVALANILKYINRKEILMRHKSLSMKTIKVYGFNVTYRMKYLRLYLFFLQKH